MKLKPPPPKKQARVEIIPLIDVIFFLLATFVLISLSMTSQPGVWVKLPESETSQPHDLAEMATVSVTEDGGLFWDKEPITFDQFLRRLVHYKEECRVNDTIPRILLNADAFADYGPCVTILDEIRKAGIEKVSIETKVKRST